MLDDLILDIFSDGLEHMYAEVLFKSVKALNDISIGSVLRVSLKNMCDNEILIKVEPGVYKLKQ